MRFVIVLSRRVILFLVTFAVVCGSLITVINVRRIRQFERRQELERAQRRIGKAAPEMTGGLDDALENFRLRTPDKAPKK